MYALLCSSLSLIGNELQCSGCSELMKPLVALCESSSFNAIKLDGDEPAAKGVGPGVGAGGPASKRADSVSGSTTAKRGSTSGAVASTSKAGEPSTYRESLSLPPLARLDLRDNAIDPHGVSVEGEQTFEPVICMRAMKRYVCCLALHISTMQ